MANKHTCPNCGSTAIASRESIYKAGTSTYSGSHSSRGLSFGFGRNFKPRLFSSGGRHLGRRSSLLADDAAPMSIVPSILIIFLIVIFGGAESFWFVIVLSVAWFSYAIYYNTTQYSRQWMCRKCHSCFFPEEVHLKRVSQLCKEIPNELLEMEKLMSVPSQRKVHEKRAEQKLQEIKTLRDSQILPKELRDNITDIINKTPLQDIIRVNRIKDLIPNVSTGKNEASRKRDAEEVHKLLLEVEINDNTTLIENFEDIKGRVTILVKVFDVSKLLDKAEKQRFLHNPKNEAKYLLEALYLLKKTRTTIKEFDSLGMKNDVNEDVWTIALIKQRLAEAGYKPTSTK